MEFDSETLTKLRGIQSDEKCSYKLIEMSMDMIRKDVIHGYTPEIIEMLAYEDMVRHIQLGGSLPAITVSEDYNVLDGQHRLAVYLKLGINKFFALIKSSIK